ncbi:MAG: Uma2 family endonuclease [Isosphaeraceae bacterium]
MATITAPMTTADLLALPDDGTERWLIAGELRERPMTRRNKYHSRTTTRVAYLLEAWLVGQPEPRGWVLTGEAGLILRRDPDSTVGVDVAYVGPEVIGRQDETSSLIEGPPILAVEILSPGDTVEDVHEKVGEYLRCGVALVWILNPYDRTVKVHRPGAEPELFNARQDISAEPHLPGFRVAVARLFD